ncbi:MAG: 3-hydroxyacyl-CoA dehydrogenase NAD-binding domain-containing protein, partial [Proteobacteria bacterium]|nr:3-hydroxyacyl-CoA dehydrogenase NAD-binding domain-containing protein [Pseudomonadota bacterium]
MMTLRNCRIETDDEGIAWLTLDKADASANSLNAEMLQEAAEVLAALEKNPPRGLVIRSGKRSGFVAGADINEFTTLRSIEQAERLTKAGQSVIDRFEALPCPSVAAIEGFALGGGLELALACTYRVAVGNDRLTLGFPEVLLGIHPGFGGTVRSVQLIGAPAALDLMLTGRNVRGTKALATGLVDRLVDSADGLADAARDLIRRRPAPRRAPWTQRLLSLAPIRPFIARKVRAGVARKVRADHYPAPYAIVDLWERYGAQGRAAYDAEAESIARLFLTSTSRNLVRVFFLQDALKSQRIAGARTPQHVHVIGAGVMGGDIAAWCALRGLEVTLQDRAEQYIKPAMERATALLEKRIKDPTKRAEAAGRLRADLEGTGIAQADVVIEAIVENVEAKRALYARIEPLMKAGAVIATNTSSIRLEELSSALAVPGRLVGLHFFNPVAQMPLIEIVQGESTATESLGSAIALARRLDKFPLPCRSAPGFLVNRVLSAYMQEAMLAGREGVPLPVIDATAVDFGMAMGPVELSDVVGLDICRHVGAIVSGALGRPLPDTRELDERIAAGKLGKKSGEGFYLWRDGKPLKDTAATPAGPAPADLQDRLMLALANEAVACLREGVVADAD